MTSEEKPGLGVRTLAAAEPAGPPAGSALDAARPPARSPLDAARAGVRALMAACALGLGAAVLQAFAAVALAGPLERVAAALAQGELARTCLGQAELSLLLAVAVFLIGRLARLFIEIPPAVGAGAGLFAAALPAVVLLFGEGASALLPAPVLAVRLSGALACALAGAAALRPRVRA